MQVNNVAMNQGAAVFRAAVPQKSLDDVITKAVSVQSSELMVKQSRDDDVLVASEGEARADALAESSEESNGMYDWQAVIQQIRADPSLAKVDKEGILPLHAACGAGAPIDAIKMLLEIYPEAAQAKCGKGYLPIDYHLALVNESPSEDIVSALMELYPGAAAVADDNNQLPIHLACMATGVSKHIFTMLLRAYPGGAYVCDIEGFYPVDYANTNKDAATRKVALEALQSNDPEEIHKRYTMEVEKEQPPDETEETLKPAQDVALPAALSYSSAISQISNKSSKSVHEIIVAVARSRSTKSQNSKLSKASSMDDHSVASRQSLHSRASSKGGRLIIGSQQVTVVPVYSSGGDEVSNKSSKTVQHSVVPVARSRSSASTKSQASKQSVKSVQHAVVTSTKSSEEKVAADESVAEAVVELEGKVTSATVTVKKASQLKATLSNVKGLITKKWKKMKSN